MKRYLLFLLFLLIPTKTFAIAYNSNVGAGGSGFWDVGASWNPVGVPGLGDTATVVAGETIQVRQNQSIGTGGAVGVFDLQVSGTLIIEDPGAGFTTIFTTNTSTKVLIGGLISIGLNAAKITCSSYVIWSFTTAVNKYYIRVDNGGALEAFGCEGFPSNGANSNIRARIASCAPNCNAGAGIVVTLDSPMNWAMVTNPATGTANPEVMVGSGGGLTNPLAFNSEIAEITAIPAVNQITVTLANNHQVGDIVANPTRNILFRSSNINNHAMIKSVGGEFNINWTRINRLGDSTGLSGAVSFDGALLNMGTIEYTSVTNCNDGAAVACFYILGASWDSFNNNMFYDTGLGGSGINKSGTPSTILTLSGWTGMRTGTTVGICLNLEVGDDPINIDLAWLSDCFKGVTGSISNVSNSLFHNMGAFGILTSEPVSYYRRITVTITHNEFRNMLNTAAIYTMVSVDGSLDSYIANNAFDNAKYTCLETNTIASLTSNMRTYNNTFDNCNWGNINNNGAIKYNAYCGVMRSDRDVFGITDPNHKFNFAFQQSPVGTDSDQARIIINEPDVVAPDNPQCGTDPICLLYASWSDRSGMGDETFVSMQNIDLVENSIFTYGPGSALIQRETVIILDGSLRVKATPFAADRYAYIPIGILHVNNGNTLTVKLWIRKDETEAAGSRPRLALEGCGFLPELVGSYDEMSDAINIWEEVLVSGVANAKGIVHVYLLVRGKDAGVGYYQPVDPPTLEIYADQISYTKS